MRFRNACVTLSVISAILLSACSGHGNGPLPAASNGITPSAKGRGFVVYTRTNAMASISSTDVRSMAKLATDVRYHGLPLQTRTAIRTHSAIRTPSTRVVYPGDVTYRGGRVYTMATEWDVYVNCPTNNESCWGRPEEFQQRLNGSGFIHLLDQYVGARGNGRYTLARNYVYGNFTPSIANTFTAGDIQSIVHSAASLTGATGYPNIYHIFLPQGYDTCADQNNTECYSPDNLNTWFFCAYHESVTFGDIGHVIYSVEPYQNVDGCNAPGNNSDELELSTASTLSHEFFEAQTDPDPPTGYTAADGQEIGDECRIFYENMQLGPGFWLIQMEYSNTYHGCADGP